MAMPSHICHIIDYSLYNWQWSVVNTDIEELDRWLNTSVLYTSEAACNCCLHVYIQYFSTDMIAVCDNFCKF